MTNWKVKAFCAQLKCGNSHRSPKYPPGTVQDKDNPTVYMNLVEGGTRTIPPIENSLFLDNEPIEDWERNAILFMKDNWDNGKFEIRVQDKKYYSDNPFDSPTTKKILLIILTMGNYCLSFRINKDKEVIVLLFNESVDPPRMSNTFSGTANNDYGLARLLGTYMEFVTFKYNSEIEESK